ncbi:rabggtb [Symbiodinium microadriaticum]|nr:rabggtb [Symbiodinium sp. KB8]CAE7892464.1 rabggtb [Symbiodinium microadriaticum]
MSSTAAGFRSLDRMMPDIALNPSLLGRVRLEKSGHEPRADTADAFVDKDMETLADMLGDSELVERFRSWSMSWKMVRTLRLLAEQAGRCIDYAALGHGFPPQHPVDRLTYREGNHSSFEKSQQRSNESAEAVRKLCKTRPSEDAICSQFVREIGCRPDSIGPVSMDGVLLALENELLLPLRSLNEGRQWMYQTLSKAPLPTAEIDRVVQEITQSVLENKYKFWRYNNPVGQRQLEGLSQNQLDIWQEASCGWVKLESGTIKIHEDEDNELGLFWATKIGGPSHGFDVEAQCHLPLLANARSKVILVSDPSYPHHPVGRAHFKMLWTAKNQPLLWLEKVNKDFRADVDTGLWSAAVLMHAAKKAKAMGVALFCDPSVSTALASVAASLDQSPVVVQVQERIVLRPSNGVTEASDYLTNKHDWLQCEEEVTGAVLRVVYVPPGAEMPDAEPEARSIRRSAIAAIAVLGTVKRHGVWLIAMDRIYGPRHKSHDCQTARAMSGSGGYVGTVQASQSKEEDLLRDKHNYYLQHLDDDKESLEYMMSEHLRMGGVYWGVSAMALLRRLDDERRDSIVEWILRCRDPKTPGGFGPNVGHDADITATHYALLVLCIFDATDKLDREGVVAFIAGLQQNDGSFAGDHWGEVDVRFAYCALSALTILDALDSIDVDACVGWILRCMNYEGSFGPVPRAESHAAYVFCAVQALALVDALGAIDVDQLGWWLCERQTPSGGFNGRPEKAPDVCYSWWILSALATIDRVHWIDVEKLADFIIAAQDGEDGGIADRPGDVPDVFHTFFGLAGLSLMRRVDLAPIHCVYALPLEVVERMNLPPILPMYDSR